MRVRVPNNVGRAVQTDPTLLHHALAFVEQRKFWESLAQKFDRFQTLRNNMQQGVQTDAMYNIQQWWVLLSNTVASLCSAQGLTDANLMTSQKVQGIGVHTGCYGAMRLDQVNELSYVFIFYSFFCQHHPLIRWCPGSDCGYLVKVVEPKAKRIWCSHCYSIFW